MINEEQKAAAKVLMGQYGNGNERIEKLRKAGVEPKAVQKIVNELIEGTYLQDVESINTNDFIELDVDLSSVKGIILCVSQ